MIAKFRAILPTLLLAAMFIANSSSSVMALLPNEQEFTVTAEIIAQLTIQKDNDLAIGKFAVQAVNGTIVVANTGNTRTAGGDAGAILLMDGDTDVQNAEFTVGGETGKTYSITTLGDGSNQAVLKTGGGVAAEDTMTFTFSVDGGLGPRTLTLGADTISIGGTLSDIDPLQNGGSYITDSVPIIIEYD